MATSFTPELNYYHALSNGDVKDFRHFAQFGFNSNLSAGAEANLWDGPTDVYTFPSDAGETMELVSDNPLDTQTIVIDALDNNMDRVVLFLPLTGTVPVIVSVNLARVNRLINISSTEFQGEVRLQGVGGGNVYAVALPAEQISTQVIFSVPRGFNAKLETSIVTLNRSGNQDTGVIVRYRRRDMGRVFATGARFGLNKRGNSVAVLPVDAVEPLPEMSDVMLMVESDQSATDVSARLPFTLYRTGSTA